MKNRILTVLCVFALLIGAFGIAAAAVDANTVATIDAQGFDNLQDAMAAEGQIVLHKDIEETVTIEKDTYIDLNGHNIAAVNVTAGTLYVSDCQTDDFTVADGVYGKIASASGNVVAARDYLMVDEEGLSFHKVDLTLTAMSLRAEKAGLYCKSNFGGDEVVAKYVKTFGVAMSIQGEPTAENLNETCRYSSFAGSKFATGEATSTLLKGIMKEERAYLSNKVNAETPVYARAYIQLKDGSYVFGNCESRSLQDQVEAISEDFTALNDTQKHAAVELFRSFKTVINTWNVQALADAYRAEQDVIETETLRILNISNSHGQDSMWLLPEVLRAEKPDQKFFIGELYAPFALTEHINAANLETPDYIYYTNQDGIWTTTEGATIKQALNDQQWDIIMFNESSRHLGLEEYMSKGLIDIFRRHILNNLDYEPVLLYNMTWASPTDDRLYTDTGRQSPPDGFKNTYTNHYGYDHVNHYNKLVELTKKYLVNHEGFDKIIYNAKPIQYAGEVLGVPQYQEEQEMDLYRDYTHLSDFARLIVAYQWYAQMFGISELTEVNVDVIPASLRATWRQAKNGDLEITQQHKDIIIESVNATLQDPFTMPEA